MDVSRSVRHAGIVVLLASSACARDARPAADSVLASGAVRDPITIGIGAKPTCPRTGHWNACGVLQRLEAAGVAPQKTESLPDLPVVGPAPLLYMVSRSGLAVYLFADSTARSRAARALDTLHFVSQATSLTIRAEATAIQSDNLLALLYSRSEQQRERVSDALTAGPPQPRAP